MREILFRGKRVDNGEWVEGAYYKQDYFYGDEVEKHIIITSSDALTNDFDLDFYEVIPETLGQFTGLTDKNGKRIFEGDIVKATGTNDHIGYVTFECGKFITRCTCHPKSVCDIHPPIEEVIGNIHDNGELLTAERSDNENQ